MPIHDWTRVLANFYDFHLHWTIDIRNLLSDELESKKRYALLEQSDDGRAADRIAIFQEMDDEVVAYVNIVGPWDKQSEDAVRRFRHHIQESLRQGRHYLAIDILPPGQFDPLGMHLECKKIDEKDDFSISAEEPCGLVSYVADKIPRIYFNRAAVGQPLPTIPLYLSSQCHIDVALDDAYQKAWNAVPQRWKKVLEAET